MLWKAKNGSVKIDDTKMCYASFGCGKKTFAPIGKIFAKPRQK